MNSTTHRRLVASTALAAVTSSAGVVLTATPAFAADTSPPVVTVTVPDPDRAGWHRKASVPVSFSVRDIGSGVDYMSSTVRLSGGQSGTVFLDGPITEVPVTANGTTTLDYSVLDNDGNRRSGSLSVKVDTMLPTAEVAGVAAGSPVRKGSVVQVSAVCGDAHSGVESCTMQSGTTLDTATTGLKEAVAVGVDVAGNEVRRAVTYRVVHDESAPTTTITPRVGSNAHGWHNGPVTVDLAAASPYPGGGVTRIDYTVGTRAGTVTGAAKTLEINAEGTTNLVAKATDLLAIEGPLATATVRIDTVRPTVSLSDPGTVRVGDVVRLAYSCDDATAGIVACNVSGDRVNAGFLDTSVPGSTTVVVSAVDWAGNESSTERVVTVEPAPVATPINATTVLTAPAVATSGFKVVTHVTVDSAEGNVAGGTVTILDNGQALVSYSRSGRPSGAARWFGDIPLSLTPGRHQLVAVYTNPGFVHSSRSAAVTVLVKSPTTATATYAVNKRGRGTARVAVVGRDARPTGLVQVFDGKKLIGTGRLAADGTVAVKLKRLKRGKHVLTARYVGTDSTFEVTTPKKTIRVR